MTTTTAPTARQLITAIADADAALAAHAITRPANNAPASAWKPWSDEVARLAAIRDAAIGAHRGLICLRCGGTGTTQFKHRLGGVCFQCSGDGFTRKGRKWWATQQH